MLEVHDGRVRLLERTLFDNDVNRIPKGEGDKDFTFKIR